MYDINTLSPLKKSWIVRNSNIPRRFLGIEPSDLDSHSGGFPHEIISWTESVYEGNVIKTFGGLGTTGVGLLMDGGPGIGKTTHAVVTAMEFIRNLPEDEDSMRRILGYSWTDFGASCRPIYYVTYPEFLSKKKSSFDMDADEKRLLSANLEGLHGRSNEDTSNVRLLVLDDLGKEYGSKYDDTSFDEVLRARYDKALPTIVTTNIMLEDWEDKYREAMSSFAREAFIRVRIVGSDLRTL